MFTDGIMNDCILRLLKQETDEKIFVSISFYVNLLP